MSFSVLNSSSSTGTCPTPGTGGPEAPFYRWLALGYTLLFGLALTANLRVLFKLFHYSRRRFRDHILLLNLCAADLFVTLVYIPSEIYAYTVGRWHNDSICKTIAALKALGIYVSSCTIIGISLDRYLSIVHPLTVYQSNTRNKLFVAGSWIISAIACVPQLIIFKRLTNEALCREMCGDILSSDPIKRMVYNVAVSLFAYVAPLLVITYSYCRILYVLHRRCDRRTFRFSKCNGNSTSEMNNNTTLPLTKRLSSKRIRPDQEEFNTHNMKTMTRAKMKTLKVTALIVICFILCWTPYYCIVFFLLITDARATNENSANIDLNLLSTTPSNLSSYQQSQHEPSRDERSLLIVMMLAVSNSVFDPMIYGCFLVQRFKSSCIRRLRTRNETTTVRHLPCPLAGDKESKLTIVRTNNKNGHIAQRGGDAAAECHL